MKTRIAGVAALLALSAAACSTDSTDAKSMDVSAAGATTTSTVAATTSTTTYTPDIVGTALTVGVFGQLAGLAIDAGLVETLKSAGPFTVFAPTDEAFPDALKPVLDVLHDPKNIDLLKAVLLYHVVPGALTTADLKDGELATAQGEPITISHDGDKVLVNGNPIAIADVKASNGVVQVITAVLVPPSMVDTVSKILAAAPAATVPATTPGTATPGT